MKIARLKIFLILETKLLSLYIREDCTLERKDSQDEKDLVGSFFTGFILFVCGMLCPNRTEGQSVG